MVKKTRFANPTRNLYVDGMDARDDSMEASDQQRDGRSFLTTMEKMKSTLDWIPNNCSFSSLKVCIPMVFEDHYVDFIAARNTKLNRSLGGPHSFPYPQCGINLR